MKGLFFQGRSSIWQQFGGIVYFGPSVWSMIDDRRENHEPLALAQTCKLLSADCCILLDIYEVDYSMPPHLQPGSSWSIPPKEGELMLGGRRKLPKVTRKLSVYTIQYLFYHTVQKYTFFKMIPKPTQVLVCAKIQLTKSRPQHNKRLSGLRPRWQIF